MIFATWMDVDTGEKNGDGNAPKHNVAVMNVAIISTPPTNQIPIVMIQQKVH